MLYASFSAGNAAMAPQPRSGWARDLLPRLLSAIVLAVVAGAALWWTTWSFAALVAAAALVLAWEWSRLCGEARFGLAGVTQALCLFVIVAAATVGDFALAWGLVPFAIAAAWLASSRGGLAQPGWGAFGPLYVGLPCIALIWLRHDDDAGRALVLWLFLAVWAADIGAYFVGRAVGGPKLAPRISPGKTWSGLGGAVVASAATGLGVGAAVALPQPAAMLGLAGGVLAIVAQIGDLVESAIKRRFGVKDSSGLIPGHGGLFDRVDGLMAAAAALALWQWTTEGSVLSWR